MWENINGSSRASDKLVHVGRTSWDISMLKCDSPGENSTVGIWLDDPPVLNMSWTLSGHDLRTLVKQIQDHQQKRLGIGWKLEGTVIVATVFTDLPELITTWFQL
jgi:hypothetical protein